MKKIILPSLLIFGLQGMSAALKTGDEVSVEALAKARFIQGTAPDEWEEGKLYVLECWATWCGPCVALIPHLEALYDKYREKGLVVIGMNVREEGEEKVARFVAKQGEGMSYPVAYVGRGGAFEEEWLQAADVSAIPHAFVVEEGKLLIQTHPMRLTSEAIEGLLEGGTEEEAILEKLRKPAGKGEAMREAAMEFAEATTARESFMTAMKARDVAAMEAAVAQVGKLDPEDPYLGWMAIEVAFVTKDWDAAKKLLETEFKRTPEFTLDRIAKEYVLRVDEAGQVSPGLLKFLAEKMEKFKGDPVFAKLQVALLQAKAGNKEEALLAANAALGEVKKGGKLPVEPFEAFVTSIENGEPLTFRGLIKNVSEAKETKQEANQDE